MPSPAAVALPYPARSPCGSHNRRVARAAPQCRRHTTRAPAHRPKPQDVDHSRTVLTAEAQGYLGAGSPEAQVFAAVPPEGISLAEIKVGLVVGGG